MYCNECGVYNPPKSTQCKICQSDLPQTYDPVHVQIGYDLTQMPFDIFKYWQIDASTFYDYIFLFSLSCFYFLFKLIRRPYYIPMFLGNTPRFHISSVKTFPSLTELEFEHVAFFINLHKFEPFIALEDKNRKKAIIQYVFIQPEKFWYCSIFVQKKTRTLSEIQFFALTKDNQYVSMDNSFGYLIHYPNNFHNNHLPTFNIETLSATFEEVLGQLSSKPRELTLKQYLLLTYKIRKYLISRGIQEQIFNAPQKAHKHQFICFTHSDRVGVHKCAGCNIALCEDCANEYQNRYYCHWCLPLHTKMLIETPPDL